MTDVSFFSTRHREMVAGAVGSALAGLERLWATAREFAGQSMVRDRRFERMRLAIWAVLLREFRSRYGDRRLGFIWAFVEPGVMVAALALLFSVLRAGDTALGYSIVPFLALGFMSYQFYNQVEKFVRTAVQGNRALLSFPRIMPLDLFLARYLLEVFTLVIVMTTMMAIFVALNLIPGPDELYRVMLPLAISSLLGLAMGILNSVLITLFTVWRITYAGLSRVLFFTSGWGFLANSLPYQAQEWLYYQPLLHLNEWVRSGYYATFESRFYEPTYPIVFAMVLLLLALVVERASRSRILKGS